MFERLEARNGANCQHCGVVVAGKVGQDHQGSVDWLECEQSYFIFGQEAVCSCLFCRRLFNKLTKAQRFGMKMGGTESLMWLFSARINDAKFSIPAFHSKESLNEYQVKNNIPLDLQPHRVLVMVIRPYLERFIKFQRQKIL
ncbi:hypothetical protein BC830DRAFT_1082411 [Chytriomyces sp. MP71]|nr:hypothetical protein BC830DRAFT_1082411 [Chytriomyces sp. MP71]